MILIVGLGNIGKQYEKTYHNIGFMVADKLAQILGLKFGKEKDKALSCEGFYNGQKLTIIKPTTYMNLSGQAVALYKKKNKEARIIVAVDDIDLPAGKIRYREKGSGGTHNGLRSIVSYVGEDFERVKIGIGRDEKIDLADYVLSKIKDTKLIEEAVESAAKMILEKI